ncbi:MAG: hypothetical protein IAE77_20855 [Prosthecobacter sp.]|nr:hypothetical protein [Prosthecobacter sp.]
MIAVKFLGRAMAGRLFSAANFFFYGLFIRFVVGAFDAHVVWAVSL